MTDNARALAALREWKAAREAAANATTPGGELLGYRRLQSYEVALRPQADTLIAALELVERVRVAPVVTAHSDYQFDGIEKGQRVALLTRPIDTTAPNQAAP